MPWPHTTTIILRRLRIERGEGNMEKFEPVEIEIIQFEPVDVISGSGDIILTPIDTGNG